MTHKFIVNTERVNEYGYRILTDGIDTEQYERNPIVLYGHNRALHNPNSVVGKCVKLTKINNELIAEIEFDVEQEYAKDLADKVERGYINMCSLHADVKETSTDEELLLPGQTLETVTKCKLVEISIVDVGGNDDALKLSRNGEKVSLQKITKQKKNENTIMKSIALALGKEENATEGILLQSVNELKLAKETAETKAQTATEALEAIQGKEADGLIKKAVSLGLIHKDFTETVKSAFDADHEAQAVKLSKMITDKEAELETDETHNGLKEVILGKGDGKRKTVKLTFDYLQKHDVAKLKDIRENNPKEYARLAKEYGKGVRHKED
jgi:phage head maturation protease